MTSRRRFLQTLAVLPPALSFGRSLAATAPDPSRLALVIGNSAYGAAPLGNPANDARAIAALLTQAGFSVDSHLDATRNGMLAAIERFGAAAKRPETRQVVFYYAGHGAQLDWRNYLLPVDALVEKQEHVRQRCVDLGLLLGQFTAAKDKTFIVILDACRNNPFGAAYRPEQKGLSQFDAPVGSLLAYATSPGNVASDGEGKNGLYTEHLVRELSQRNTRIEDALKRVRLNVRLASRGSQVPWETTSLEGDVFLFREDQKKPSEAELEKQLEADVTEWTRIKSSKSIDDWVGYLRSFPNGRFAEIAQMRLNRLLADMEKQRLEREQLAATAAPTSSKPGTPPPEGFMINIGAGLPVPVLIAPSENPYSAGRYRLGRLYTVGDEAILRTSDILTGIENRSVVVQVTRVDYEQDRVDFNNGQFVTDLMGNTIKSGAVVCDAPVQFNPAELHVGKKWTAAYRRTENGIVANGYFDMQIVARETINVPAGRLDSFRFEGLGWDDWGNRLEIKLWQTPGLGFAIRREKRYRDRFGRYFDTERLELVALRQQAIGAI